ncbi:MAG: Hsp20/alpha crystallin family protein [Deltaproteobacteria bacterium]|nr:Hsp20/alpha crystallin family protein [Deltaproteobacteria bacterium]
MSLHITRRDSDRSPFGLARELLGWDPFTYGRVAQTFTPTFEVKETAEAFVVRADLPGVKESDLDVSVHNGVLSISGSRAAEQRQEGDSFYVYERQFGSFSRSFGLPESADAEKVEARLEQGVLQLTIGKKVQAKPRKIELKKA